MASRGQLHNASREQKEAIQARHGLERWSQFMMNSDDAAERLALWIKDQAPADYTLRQVDKDIDTVLKELRALRHKEETR